MSKVRINDLAREMEGKSRQILDVLGELGLGEGKTHSSSIEEHEADKVRAHFDRAKSGTHATSASSRASQTITPKIDLSHVSKPGDVMKAIWAKKQEQEAEARKSHLPARPAAPPAPKAPAKPAPPAVTIAAPPAAASAKPEPRKIGPQPRPAPAIIPPAPPAIASKPPAGAVVAKAPASAGVTRPAVAVVPPTAVAKPHVAAAHPKPA